jgi:hypothetical protein
MIDYNLVLYIGIGLIVFGFVLFLVSIHFERQAEIKLFKQEQLKKSFDKNKAKVFKTVDSKGDMTIWYQYND